MIVPFMKRGRAVFGEAVAIGARDNKFSFWHVELDVPERHPTGHVHRFICGYESQEQLRIGWSLGSLSVCAIHVFWSQECEMRHPNPRLGYKMRRDYGLGQNFEKCQ